VCVTAAQQRGPLVSPLISQALAAAPLTCRVRSGGSPTEVLAALATGAEAIAASSALVALNLVAPEADPLALRDYWIQVLPNFCVYHLNFEISHC